MGKTETIKKRAIYVYLPSQEMTDRWKELAASHGSSISRFVAEHVEKSLRDEGVGYEFRGSLLEENRKLFERLEEKDTRIRHLEMLVDKLEEDLRRYRAEMFLDEGFMGVRSYDRKLIEVLREPGFHRTEEILSRLGIKPSEYDAIGGLSKQLEQLQSYGLVRSTPRGWTWGEKGE